MLKTTVTENHMVDRLLENNSNADCAFFIYLFFFFFNWVVFERRGRNAFFLLLNDNQDCTGTGDRKSKYDLFPSNVASETTTNA